MNQVADGVQLDAFFGHEQGAKVMAALNAAVTMVDAGVPNRAPIRARLNRQASSSPTHSNVLMPSSQASSIRYSLMAGSRVRVVRDLR